MHIRNLTGAFLTALFTINAFAADKFCESTLKEAGVLAFPQLSRVSGQRHEQIVKEIRAQFKQRGFAVVDVGDLFTEEAGAEWFKAFSKTEVTLVDHENTFLATSGGRLKPMWNTDPKHRRGLSRMRDFFADLVNETFKQNFRTIENQTQARFIRENSETRFEVPHWHVDTGDLVVIITIHGNDGTDVLGVTEAVRIRCRKMSLDKAPLREWRKICDGAKPSRAGRGEVVIFFGDKAENYNQLPLVHRSPPDRGDAAVFVIRFDKK